MPLKLTLRHHFDFGADRHLVGDDLARPEAWDALRTQSRGPFALARTQAELGMIADLRPEIRDRGRVLDKWLERRGVKVLASYGVGSGVLEFWLHRLRPERRLLLTEYAPQTVAGLRAIFPDLVVMAHDLLQDAPLRADMHLFHRIDTEVSNHQFGELLYRFSREPVIVVATGVASLRHFAKELVLRMRGRGTTRAGWLRTRGAFDALWLPTHDATAVRFHDLDGWILEPREEGKRAGAK